MNNSLYPQAADCASLQYYKSNGAALVPIPAGSKIATGIISSFKHDWSRNPEQIDKWARENPGCNFGVVAFASNLIIVDIDTKGDNGREEAWALWAELCASWGLPAALVPHVQSPSGGWHVYCTVPDGVDAATLRQPDAIKGRINIRCIGYTVAAGSYYDGRPYQLMPGAPPPHPAPEGLIQHCSGGTRKVTEHRSRQGEHSLRDVRSMLAWMNERDAFDSYEDWISIGQALKICFWDDGLELWESVTVAGRYSCDQKWETFKDTDDGNAVTLATWFQRARKAGWQLAASEMFGSVASIGSPSLAPTTPRAALLKSSAEFLEGFVPPDYILDGVLQRGFCYSMTAKTGTGKTAVAMCFSAHVATGRSLNGLSVSQGDVIYLAGENPTDIQMRWLGLTQEMRIDPQTVPVYFLPGVISVSQNVAAIEQEVKERALQPMLVVVDTAAAYFEGDNENDNVQQGNNARLLRSLTNLPGRPCVLILCHPTKRAADDDLMPRGGGAFLNEVDGNIALKANDTIIGAEVQGKFRGPAFSPLAFKLDAVREHPLLKDSKGRSIPTVIARAIGEGEMASNHATQERDENKLLRLLEQHPKASLQELATLLGGAGKSKVNRLVQKLIDTKLIRREGRKIVLTQIGQKELNDLEPVVSPSFRTPFPGVSFPPLPPIKN
ncbi:RecA-family ATPase [Nitrobacter winogradskyi Nb-255]|uniref:RecA-family ATPase n=1 Tax=Nitrobacter winogradskyi (strain ATCC 25391 / DSM 10237 / CIP 104748 / NCIMB 11846 / Nb-255) TaxID=323098 RepID=Q3SS51_NITWN|nr:bifunctional DNA primase/polymerase [Nitrobacter winogradskyi]ABA04890.1 RecA-family ATPase [Nitrobacter winogradskyi Nb-255]